MCYAEKGANYAVQISNVEILPDPVVRGEPFTFKIKAYTGYTSFPTYLSFFFCWRLLEGGLVLVHYH
jgi:hypothetical protein